MAQYKVVGSIIHQVHHTMPVFYDGFPVTPGNGSHQKSGDLNILFQGVTVRDTHRVISDKTPVIVLVCF